MYVNNAKDPAKEQINITIVPSCGGKKLFLYHLARIPNAGTGEVVQRLRTLVALAENPG